MNKYILALDQGTTSSRSIIYDWNANPIANEQKEFKQIFPKPGWVEHDAVEIWESQLEVTKKVLKNAGFDIKDLAAIGITNQRETTVLWNRETGKPIYNAIVWQDRRTAKYCDSLKQKGFSKKIAKKQVWFPMPIFREQKLNGFWIMLKERGKWPMKVCSLLAPLTPG